VAAVLGVLVVVPLGLLARVGWDPLIGSAWTRLFVLGPLAVWLAGQRRWRLFWLVVVGGALVGPLNHVLKVIFDRPRPDYDGTIEMYRLLYPSGHTAGAAAVATILLLVFWPVFSRAGRLVLIVPTIPA
jgi:membrane-associated phospholipid phosphatase